jgi:DNA polymerase-4
MTEKVIRKILHLDLDAFFCAVEEMKDPSLRGKAFAVGGQAGKRGVISTCSYPARRFGVHSAMPTGQAMRLCPNLILISSNFGDYHAKSQQVMAILHDLSGLVEQVSVDEAFIDVSDLPEDADTIAHELQKKVMQQTGLPCSIGAASCKLVAKIATDTGKSQSKGNGYPCSIMCVPPGEERAFLAPLPTKAMWGVGPKMEASLAEMGLRTIGDIASCPVDVLERRFGKYGADLHRHAQGIDNRPVTIEYEAKSISQEVTFAKDTTDLTYLRGVLRDLSFKVGYRMRSDGVCARVIRIKLRWSDFTTHTRQVALANPTDQDSVIYATAESLLMKLWQSDRPVRLIGVGAANLIDQVHQLSLFDQQSEKERRLLDALDDLREKYGKGAIQRADRLDRKNPRQDS